MVTLSFHFSLSHAHYAHVQRTVGHDAKFLRSVPWKQGYTNKNRLDYRSKGSCNYTPSPTLYIDDVQPNEEEATSTRTDI